MRYVVRALFIVILLAFMALAMGDQQDRFNAYLFTKVQR